MAKKTGYQRLKDKANALEKERNKLKKALLKQNIEIKEDNIKLSPEKEICNTCNCNETTCKKEDGDTIQKIDNLKQCIVIFCKTVIDSQRVFDKALQNPNQKASELLKNAPMLKSKELISLINKISLKSFKSNDSIKNILKNGI